MLRSNHAGSAATYAIVGVSAPNPWLAAPARTPVAGIGIATTTATNEQHHEARNMLADGPS